MKIYLDVSCLNRPWDDQTQARIRLESAALAIIFERMDEGRWVHASSEMVDIEVEATKDRERRKRIDVLLADAADRIRLTTAIFERADALKKLGFQAADAVHIAAAEACGATVLLSCDDRMVRRARQVREQIRVRVVNPVEWLVEQNNASDT